VKRKKIGKFRFTWRGRTPRGLPRHFGTRPIGFLHAEKGGAPVLIGEASWRTVCGVYGNVHGGFFTVQWSRHWDY
jgi:hypothetical protein